MEERKGVTYPAFCTASDKSWGEGLGMRLIRHEKQTTVTSSPGSGDEASIPRRKVCRICEALKKRILRGK